MNFDVQATYNTWRSCGKFDVDPQAAKGLQLRSSLDEPNHLSAIMLDNKNTLRRTGLSIGLLATSLFALAIWVNLLGAIEPERAVEGGKPAAATPPGDTAFDPTQPAAQSSAQPRFNLQMEVPGLGGDGGLSGGGIAGGLGFGSDGENVFFSAQLKVEEGTSKGVVSLTADINDGWHVFSITQPAGGPTASKVELVDNLQVAIKGDFTADREPKIHETPFFKVPAEEHYGKVTWSAPVELAPGVDPSTVAIEIQFSGQVCSEGTCIPIDPRSIPVKYAGTIKPVALSGVYQPPTAKLTLEGSISPSLANPGSEVTVTITAKPAAGYHVYAHDPNYDPKAIGNKPTLLVLSPRLRWEMGEVTASSNPTVKKSTVAELPDERYYDAPITWTFPVKVPEDATFGEFSITGYMGFQTCNETSCLLPTGAQFKATVQVSPDSPTGTSPIVFSDYSFAEVEKLVTDAQALKLIATPGGRDLPINWSTLTPILGLAFLGGLILNLMPCVLPVLGLKILSFAKQGGQSRGKVIMLNVAYTAGLLLVFLILAALVSFANMGWGEQFTQLWFRVTVTAIVFVMSLSFLGVWELPIPGFATSEKASELQSQEGIQGAFYKGIFTTVIATPCSGPFLGTVLGLTLDQPIPAIFLIFTMAGLGMASPYLFVGLFPQLSRIIPKPGAWMETFERLLGFLMLLAAVVQFSTIGAEHYTATLMLMVGLAFACWVIGRIPETASTNQKITSWLTGAAAAATVGFLAFAFLAPPKADEELPWQPFSQASLAQLQSEGKTILIDFTADWCLTCQYNGRTAINTSKVNELVKKNGVVPLLADWTNPSPEIKAQLAALRKNSIPLLVIYPAGKPEDAIVLPDLLFEAQVIDALEKAGPSQSASSATSAGVGSTNRATR